MLAILMSCRHFDFCINVYKHYLNMCLNKNEQFKELKIKLNADSEVSHSIFLRKHIVREQVPEKPVNKTLFVSGVPPFFNQDSLRKLFSAFGEVTAIYLHKTPSPKLPPENKSKFFRTVDPITGFKFAYIVFNTAKCVEAALKNNKVIVATKDMIQCGMKKWSQEYNDRIPDPKMMEEEIETFMALFDKKTAKEKDAKKAEGQPDADGWVTVTKKGRKPGFSRNQAVIEKLKKDEERRRQKKELTNFYRFQIKESKMKNLVTLREKFEEDKKRIAAMKATRRFKPF